MSMIANSQISSSQPVPLLQPCRMSTSQKLQKVDGIIFLLKVIIGIVFRSSFRATVGRYLNTTPHLLSSRLDLALCSNYTANIYCRTMTLLQHKCCNPDFVNSNHSIIVLLRIATFTCAGSSKWLHLAVVCLQSSWF